MSTLAEVLAEHRQYPDGIRDLVRCSCDPEASYTPDQAWASHLAAVVAEWLTSERVVQVASYHHFREEFGGCLCGDTELGKTYDNELHAKHQLSALAAYVRGETDE